MKETTRQLLSSSAKQKDKSNEGYRLLADPATGQSGVHGEPHEPTGPNKVPKANSSTKNTVRDGATTEETTPTESIKTPVIGAANLQPSASHTFTDGKPDGRSSTTASYQTPIPPVPEPRHDATPDDGRIPRKYPKPDFNMDFSVGDLNAPKALAGPEIPAARASTHPAAATAKEPGYRERLRRAVTVFRRPGVDPEHPNPHPNPDDDPDDDPADPDPDPEATRPRSKRGRGSRVLALLTRGRHSVVGRVLRRPDRKTRARGAGATEGGVNTAAMPGAASGEDLVGAVGTMGTMGTVECELVHPTPKRVIDVESILAGSPSSENL